MSSLRASLACALLTLLPVLAAGAQGTTPLAPTGAACLTSDGKAIPLIERPTGPGSAPLVLLLTGDGGWANADQKVAEGLVARGSPVVGVNMRAYLGTRRTPDEAARDLACVAQRYLQLWRRQRVLLLGYSRGADIAPFAAARWPQELRDKVAMVALVSMSSRANFQFHLIDLVRDVARDDDVAIAPEIARLRGLRVICVYGESERDSGCLQVDSTIVQRYARAGGHRLVDGFDAIVDLLVPALAPVETR